MTGWRWIVAAIAVLVGGTVLIVLVRLGSIAFLLVFISGWGLLLRGIFSARPVTPLRWMTAAAAVFVGGVFLLLDFRLDHPVVDFALLALLVVTAGLLVRGIWAVVPMNTLNRALTVLVVLFGVGWVAIRWPIPALAGLPVVDCSGYDGTGCEPGEYPSSLESLLLPVTSYSISGNVCGESIVITEWGWGLWRSETHWWGLCEALPADEEVKEPEPLPHPKPPRSPLGAVGGEFSSIAGGAWEHDDLCEAGTLFDLNLGEWVEARTALEFPIAASPSGPPIHRATLSLFHSNGNGLDQLALYGYAGDGLIDAADAVRIGVPIRFAAGTLGRTEQDVTSLLTPAVLDSGWAGFSIRADPPVLAGSGSGQSWDCVGEAHYPILTIEYDSAL